jgi:hypothetical protein
VKVVRPTPEVGWLEAVSRENSEWIVKASGWAHYAEGNLEPKTVLLISNGHILAQASTGLDRPDVAETFSNIDFKGSGWKAAIYVSRLRMGPNVITAYLLLDKHTLVELNGTKTFLLE